MAGRILIPHGILPKFFAATVRAMEVVRAHFAAPIPVGHRVRVRWYYAPRQGAGPLMARPHEPVIEDLDTGVRYAPAWALHPTADHNARALSQLRDEPPESLRVERTVEGEVVATTVVTLSANPAQPIQTRLVVRPAPPQSAYR